MGVNFTPEMKPYKEQGAFRFWCQKILPLVYDDSMSYYELLTKVLEVVNTSLDNLQTEQENIDALHAAYDELQEYVNDYFNNLDVQNEINNKLNQMASNGQLTSLLTPIVSPLIPENVAAWLAENLTETSPPVDKSLKVSNAAADSQVTGEFCYGIANSYFNVPRINTADPDGKYVLNRGFYTGLVGEIVEARSTGLKTVRFSSHIIPVCDTYIKVPEGFKINVRVCVPTETPLQNEIIDILDYSYSALFITLKKYSYEGIRLAINIQKADGTDISDADITTIRNNIELLYAYKRNSIRTFKATMEHGTLVSGKISDSASNYDTFYNYMRTVKFINVSKCERISALHNFDSLKMICYSREFSYTNTIEMLNGVEFPIDSTVYYVRFLGYNETPIENLYNTITISIRGEASEVFANTQTENDGNILTCFAMKNTIKRDTDSEETDEREICDSTYLLRLPPNYSPLGSPVPLIVYAHGSSDYGSKWQTKIRGQVGTEEVITYLVNEGYAVLDAFGHSSDAPYTEGYAHTYGNVDCMNCYNEAIRRTLNNYNINKDGIYLTGISSGGLTVLNLMHQNNWNFKCCAPFAPTISIFNRWLGYSNEQRLEYAWAMGFTGDSSVLVADGVSDTANSYPEYTQDLIDYFTENAPRTIGYNPMWNGLVGISQSQLTEWGIEPGPTNRLGGGDRPSENWEDKYRCIKLPTKIWVANDDVNVPPSIIKNYIKTAVNGQNVCELRLIPDGRGGHYAFTSSPNAHKVSGFTALGIAYTDIPDPWIELVEFFRQY